MKKRIVSILMAGVLAVSVLAGCSKSESDTQDASFVTESTEVGMTTETETETQAVEKGWYQVMLEKSLLSVGTNGRLQKFFEKLENKEAVSVAYFGGSITEGAGAKKVEESYANLVTDKLKKDYQGSPITPAYAGLGGTSSAVGVMRYDRNVVMALGDTPDLLFIEFAVNDYEEPTDGKAYESLIRKALEDNPDTAVVLVFSVFKSKWNMQDKYIPLGSYYGLPMVSIKKAVDYAYGEKELTDAEYFSDEYHPTSYGHSIMADCIGYMFEQAKAADPSTIVENTELPPAKYGTQFKNMKEISASKPNGAVIDPGSFNQTDNQVQAFFRTGEISFADNWLNAGEGNKDFVMKLDCKTLLMNAKSSNSADYGVAEIYIDGELVKEVDGHSDGGWDSSNPVLLLDEKESAAHEIRIHMKESGKKFTILAFGYTDANSDTVSTGLFGGMALKDVYANNFPIGVALPANLVRGKTRLEGMITSNYNSLTCENEMKPDALLDKSACQNDLTNTYLNPAVSFNSCKSAIEYAQNHNMKIRFHTLVWYSQTPKWFFTEDYKDGSALVSREVMLKRMENYIKKVLTYFKDNYPGLIYAVDVANECFDVGDGDENAIRKKNNLWYDTVGPDYYYYAFVYARKYAAKDMKLFYNDYGCMFKDSLIIERLQKAKDEGLIDGIGMQSHLSTDDMIVSRYMLTVKKFCEAGYEVQATELDIGIKNTDEKSLMKQAKKYRMLFKCMKQLQEDGYPVTGITIWGVDDSHSWRASEYPLLFDKQSVAKPAYLGAMLSPAIPDSEY